MKIIKQIKGYVKMDNMDGNIWGMDSENVAGVLLDAITDEQFNKVNNLCGEKFSEMYDGWVELHGKKIANEWLTEHGGYIVDYEDIEELAQVLVGNFIT